MPYRVEGALCGFEQCKENVYKASGCMVKPKGKLGYTQNKPHLRCVIAMTWKEYIERHCKTQETLENYKEKTQTRKKQSTKRMRTLLQITKTWQEAEVQLVLLV